jgi:hypothetical protein
MAQYFTRNGNHYDKCPEKFVNVINEQQKSYTEGWTPQ